MANERAFNNRMLRWRPKKEVLVTITAQYILNMLKVGKFLIGKQAKQYMYMYKYDK